MIPDLFQEKSLADHRCYLSENQFTDFSTGVTHLEVAGPPDGEPVVFVHGLTTPMFIWDEQFYDFAERGFRVYRYDLYGRGYSDRPDVRYDTDLYVRQLKDLVDWIDDDWPINLVGLSLGGAITTNYTVQYNEDVKRLCLIAPAGLPESMPFWYYGVTAPGVGEAFFYTLGRLHLKYFGYRNLTSDADRLESARMAMRKQFEYAGCMRAILSTLRYGPVYREGETYRALGEGDCPVRAIWSRADSVVPAVLHERLEEFVPRAEVNLLPEGKHTVNYDHPGPVNRWIGEFLRDA